jgi:protein FAM50
VKKKLRKNAVKGKLSFGLDEEDEVSSSSANPTPRSKTPASDAEPLDKGDAGSFVAKRRLGPNNSISFKPKILTKSALLKEAQTREQLRKEFLAVQETVKATEMVIPFVFYDGTNIPGGACRVKKGDHVWFFLDKARKVGAELGVGGDNARKSWARISVDDLMLVRGEIIVPPVKVANESTQAGLTFLSAF